MDFKKLSEFSGGNGDSLCDSRVEELENQNTEESPKQQFNGHMKMESYYKDKVDEFVKSAPDNELVIVLIDFCAVGGKGLKWKLIPGEMALSAFSLKSGVIDNCSFCINHGNKAPTKVLQSINNLLELPTSLEPENNYENCIRTLNLFRKKHRYGNAINQHALLFCRKSEYDRVTSCLDFLFERKGGDSFGYQIFPLEYLLGLITYDIFVNKGYTRFDHSFDEEVTKILDAPNFKELRRLACGYHRKATRGFYYCALRNVNIHTYNITGSLAEEAIIGVHFPSVLNEWDELIKRHNQLQYWSTIFQSEPSIPIPENYKPEEIQIKSSSCSSSTKVEIKKSPEPEELPVEHSPPEPEAIPVEASPPVPVSNTQENTPLSEPVSPPQNNPTNIYAGQNMNMSASTFYPGFFICPTLVPLPLLLLQMPAMGSFYYFNPIEYQSRPNTPDNFNSIDLNRNPMAQIEHPMSNMMRNADPRIFHFPNALPNGLQPQSIPPVPVNDHEAPNTTSPKNNDI